MLKHFGDKIVRNRLTAVRRIRMALFYTCLGFVSLLILSTTDFALTLLAPPEIEAKNQVPIAEQQGILRVVTRISPNTYFESDEGPSGFEYALLERFARSINKELEIITTDSHANLFRLLDRNEAHFASAGLTVTEERSRHYIFSTPYLQSQPIVVYRVGNSKPRKIKDLIGKVIVVTADSSHSALLEDLRNKYPNIQWREIRNIDYIDVLGRVENGNIDYTVIDSTEFMLHRGFFPRVKKAFSIGKQQSFSWVMSKSHTNSALLLAANRFITGIKADGTLAKLEEQYYGQAAHISQVSANEFAKNINNQLPLYIDNIKAVAEEFEMDWRLLAAISYQESRWNPLARSRTGVRGLMMLTLPTAKEVGVSNRLDPDQSLRGGATYLNNLIARLPKRILEPDRSWFALAAYNVGFGHLEDARVITSKRGGDPDSWYDVKQSLPLLTQKKWYSQTRYGYARGYEPVQYVQHIRHYHNVLQWKDITRNWQYAEDIYEPLTPKILANDEARF